MQSEPSEPSEKPDGGEPSSIVGPLRLIHLMFLTAAAALTFAAWPLVPRLVSDPFDSWGPRASWEARVVLTYYAWSPILAGLLLAGPGERRRRMARSYGTGAVAATSAALVFLTLTSSSERRSIVVTQKLQATMQAQTAAMTAMTSNISRVLKGEPAITVAPPTPVVASPWFSPLALVLARGRAVAAGAVVGAWSALALTGVGRRPLGWLDGICLLLAVLFVAFSGGDEVIGWLMRR